MTLPILWTFRRCPYAMRARLAIASADVNVELREILLRDKPEAFLKTSPKGTVPVVETASGVIEESLDVMLWALGQNDPEGWLEMNSNGFDLIAEADGSFKTSLDRYKYATRQTDVDVDVERHTSGLFLHNLNHILEGRAFLFADMPRLADMAILPFVRQFAHVDLDWFESQPWSNVISWLNAFKTSDRFAYIMTKYPPWTDDQDAISFPPKVA